MDGELIPKIKLSNLVKESKASLGSSSLVATFVILLIQEGCVRSAPGPSTTGLLRNLFVYIFSRLAQAEK